MIGGLLDWYAARLDGEWEHRHGFTIESCDNPGLRVILDIAPEPSRDRLIAVEGEEGRDWMELRVSDGRLIGFASPGRERRLFARIDRVIGGGDG